MKQNKAQAVGGPRDGELFFIGDGVETETAAGFYEKDGVYLWDGTAWRWRQGWGVHEVWNYYWDEAVRQFHPQRLGDHP